MQRQTGNAIVTKDIRWFALVLFIGNLGLVALGIASLWRITNGNWLGIIAALVFTIGYGVIWKQLLAPGSPKRLRFKERLILNLVICPIVVILSALASLWVPALIASSVILLGDALNEHSR